ncbi:MAG: hypothetical protein MJZ23_01500 [Paludibacteraceae bacterium]|nr:hypothetical protein [Paludibacteraceae bacterium]
MRIFALCTLPVLAMNVEAAEPLTLELDTTTTLFGETKQAMWGMPDSSSTLWEEQDFSKALNDYLMWDGYRQGAKNVTNDLKGYEANAIDLYSSHIRKGDNAMPYNGVFGPRNKRLQVYVSDYTRTGADNAIRVFGVTKRGKQTHPFTGSIKVQKVLQTPKAAELRTKTDTASYTLLATYELEEDRNEEGTGILKGSYYAKVNVLATFNFMTNELKRQILTDRDGADNYGYSNRNFVGTWTSYRTGETLKAIWGDNLLPFSLDFRIGIGEVLNEKYVDNDWKKYSDNDSEIEAVYDEEGEQIGIKQKDEWWNR